jgi:DNA mismatch endonuclease Vsr
MPLPSRSYNMSRIRSKDTKPEMLVRKFLWSRGFRYRLNSPRLPGHPDLVLFRYRTCIFVKCAPLGIRTLDPLIKSQLLYQLS